MCVMCCDRCSLCEFSDVSSSKIAEHSEKEHQGEATHVKVRNTQIEGKVLQIFRQKRPPASNDDRSLPESSEGDVTFEFILFPLNVHVCSRSTFPFLLSRRPTKYDVSSQFVGRHTTAASRRASRAIRSEICHSGACFCRR